MAKQRRLTRPEKRKLRELRAAAWKKVLEDFRSGRIILPARTDTLRIYDDPMRQDTGE